MKWLGGRDPVPVFVADAPYKYANMTVFDRVWPPHLVKELALGDTFPALLSNTASRRNSIGVRSPLPHRDGSLEPLNRR